MYYEKGDLGGVFLSSGRDTDDLDLGKLMELELSFLEEQVHFRLKGTVRWRRPKGASNSRSLPPGVGIEFAPEHKNTRQLLLDYAMGREVALVHRDNRRFPVEIGVKAKMPTTSTEGKTDDLSIGGALLLLGETLPLGTEMGLVLRIPGRLFGLSIRARVAWEKRDPPLGVGVEFVYENDKKRQQVERVVDELRKHARDAIRVRVAR